MTCIPDLYFLVFCNFYTRSGYNINITRRREPMHLFQLDCIADSGLHGLRRMFEVDETGGRTATRVAPAFYGERQLFLP